MFFYENTPIPNLKWSKNKNDYCFRDLLQFEVKTGCPDDLNLFTDTLNLIRRRHLDTVPLMAQAVFKMNNVSQSDGVTDTVQYFLDRLYTNRYQRRIGQRK